MRNMMRDIRNLMGHTALKYTVWLSQVWLVCFLYILELICVYLLPGGCDGR